MANQNASVLKDLVLEILLPPTSQRTNKFTYLRQCSHVYKILYQKLLALVYLFIHCGPQSAVILFLYGIYFTV